MDNFFNNDIFGSIFGGIFGTKEYSDTLDKLYFTDPLRYLKYLNELKSKGYKVLRNSKGKHKVEVR